MTNPQNHDDARTSPTADQTAAFDRVENPYGNAHNVQEEQLTEQSQPLGAQEPPVPLEPETSKREKRRVSIGTAVAMTLVAAIASGTLTGVYSTNRAGNSGSTTRTQVAESLRQPVSQGHPAPVEGSVEDVAAKVLPSVVSILVATRNGSAEGSGSIISEDGYVMTNNHVVAGAEQGAARISVTLNDGSEHPAELIAGDPNTDVAVIKIKDVSGLPVMKFGDSNNLTVGQQVVAVGSPLGLSATVTSGIVSALNRPVRAGGSETGQSSLIDAVQTDAAINPGNSGGPLVDANGALIGMNSVIASLSAGGKSESGSIGLGFAIPSNFARRVASQLIEKGYATQPMIGIQLISNANAKGAVIADVQPDGPGAHAGLQAGEVITKINDRHVDSADALIAAVRSSDFGQTVKLTVRGENDQNERQVDVTLTGE